MTITTGDWFPQHRQEWIADVLHVYGFINRDHLMRKFRMSSPAASHDLQRFQRENPDAVVYNLARKCYVVPGRERTIR